MNKIPIIVVAGATASGKTALAVDIAECLAGEVVSADSMQIYKYMDIGSAKPTPEEMRGVPHHLIDYVDPCTPYSAADYTAAAHEVIADIHARGRVAVVAGGTGLYVSSLVNDVDFTDAEGDSSIRAELRSFADEHGTAALYEELKRVDPEQAERIHPNNVKRVIRAIEFYRLTGKKISEHQADTKKTESRYDALMMMIDFERAALYERIERRVDLMMSEGLLDEVKRLKDMGLTRESLSMQGIGYKEVLDYLDGRMSLDDTIALIKQSTRRYAKRQLTWFRRDPRIHAIPAGAEAFPRALALIDEWAKERGYEHISQKIGVRGT